ncbi:MAG: hypothetical protein RR501_12715, partial [Cloacibacillus sp.]
LGAARESGAVGEFSSSLKSCRHEALIEPEHTTGLAGGSDSEKLSLTFPPRIVKSETILEWGFQI